MTHIDPSDQYRRGLDILEELVDEGFITLERKVALMWAAWTTSGTVDADKLINLAEAELAYIVRPWDHERPVV